MKHYTDQELIQGINNSVYRDFDELYARYWQFLLGVALKKTGDRDSAMDAVQDLFVDIWNKREVLVVQKSVKSYLISSLYFKLFMQFRKRGMDERLKADYAYFLEQSEGEIREKALDFEREYEALVTAIELTAEEMPLRMREIFKLKYQQSLSNHEISQRLGLSQQTVKNQLTKALHVIRHSLAASQLDAAYSVAFLLWYMQ